MATDNKILKAIEAFGAALGQVGPGLQEIGVGVNSMTGASTEAQTLAALKALEDLKKGRMDAKSQMELAKNLEKFKGQLGIQTEMSQSPTGITETYKTPDYSKQTSKSALAYAASQDPALANNPVIQAYLGIAPPKPQESFLPQQEQQRQNRLNAAKIQQTPYKLETEMKTIKGVAVPQQKKTMLTISDRNAIMKAAAAEAESSKNEDRNLAYSRILKELGYVIPGEDISGTKGGKPSFQTEDEALASGIKGEVFISGKLARID